MMMTLLLFLWNSPKGGTILDNDDDFVVVVVVAKMDMTCFECAVPPKIAATAVLVHLVFCYDHVEICILPWSMTLMMMLLKACPVPPHRPR
jgi:hypothetical protein